MKNAKKYTLLVIMVFAVIISCTLQALATEVPSGVKPQEVKATNTFSSASGMAVDIRNGVAMKSTQTENNKEGDIVGIPVDYVYTCTFYNVGEMGGSQYAKAKLTLTWVAKAGGLIYYMFQHPAQDEPYLMTKENETLPVFEPQVILEATFSGGPDGTFKGTTSEGEEVTFSIIENGTVLTGFKGTGMLVSTLTVESPETAWAGWVEQNGNDIRCQFSGMTGQVEILLPGASDWKLAKMDSQMPVGTHIRTQEDSKAIISFADMSTFVLSPESEIVITAPPGKESKISIVAGDIWANVKKMVTQGSMEIEMNQAVCGIKGTTFVCEENDGKSTLKVIEGTVEFTSKTNGESVLVEGGQQIVADSGGLSDISSFDITAEEAEWAALETTAASDPEVIVTAEPDRDNGVNPLLILIVIAVGVIVVVIITVVLLVTARKRKRVR